VTVLESADPRPSVLLAPRYADACGRPPLTPSVDRRAAPPTFLDAPDLQYDALAGRKYGGTGRDPMLEAALEKLALQDEYGARSPIGHDQLTDARLPRALVDLNTVGAHVVTASGDGVTVPHREQRQRPTGYGLSDVEIKHHVLPT
jgi:hypothetical protein